MGCLAHRAPVTNILLRTRPQQIYQAQFSNFRKTPDTLWNTRYLDAALTELRRQGHLVREEDAARLSPLGHAHLNELGRYTFPVRDSTTALRPLRDPAADNDLQ